VWLIVLSDQLPIVALVGRYPANKLIGRRPLQRRLSALALGPYAVLAPVSQGCPPPLDMFLRVPHPSATPRCRGVRLACVKHSASVRSEPGSNSQVHHARPGRNPATQTPLDRAPLTTLDAKRSLKPKPRTDTAPSRDSTGRQGRKRALACFQKTYAAVKDRLPRTAQNRRRNNPASLRGKEPVPEGTKIMICSRTAHHFQTPPVRPKAPPTGPERATAPLQGTRLGARERQFQGSVEASPKGAAFQRTANLMPRGSDFKAR
jgi:hypothetical protein